MHKTYYLAKLKCFQMILLMPIMWNVARDHLSIFHFMGIENSWGSGLWGWSEFL